jgi:uncharacterized protein YigE (DUF2233 family)
MRRNCSRDKGGRILTSVFRAWIAVCALLALPACAGDGWEELEPGISLGRFRFCSESSGGDAVITVVRVDPDRFELRLLEAAGTEARRGRTVSSWARDYDLAVAINAGMYHPDGLKHVGYMATRDCVNNPVAVKSYKSVLAFDPKRAGLPPVRLADLELTTLDALQDDYHTLIQNLRMISHRRTNVWSPSDKRWSTAALGIDGGGRLLFLFCRSPYSVHELNDCLLRLPIDIARAQYLEGGPEASLHLSAGGRELTLAGSLRDDGGDGNGIPWAIPNVIGVARPVAVPER